MELVKTVLVFIYLKLKELGIFAGKTLSIFGGGIIICGVALAALGGITLGVWYYFNPVSAEATIVAYRVTETDYFLSYISISLLIGFAELFFGMAILVCWGCGGIFSRFLGRFLADNWVLMKQIVVRSH